MSDGFEPVLLVSVLNPARRRCGPQRSVTLTVDQTNDGRRFPIPISGTGDMLCVVVELEVNLCRVVDHGRFLDRWQWDIEDPIVTPPNDPNDWVVDDILVEVVDYVLMTAVNSEIRR